MVMWGYGGCDREGGLSGLLEENRRVELALRSSESIHRY